MTFTSKGRGLKPHQEQKDAERKRLEAALEAGLEGTFPASDAVAVTQPIAERYPTLSFDLFDASQRLKENEHAAPQPGPARMRSGRQRDRPQEPAS